MRDVCEVKPIGSVHIGERGFCLKIDHEFRPALKELGEFSHIHVLWWAHLTEDIEGERLQVAHPYRNSPDRVGIFATRSQTRPNPIGLTTVAVLGVDEQEGIIYTPYFDMEDGTPILDIKPYHPSNDRIRDAGVPGWCAHWPKWYEDSADFDWTGEFVNAT